MPRKIVEKRRSGEYVGIFTRAISSGPIVVDRSLVHRVLLEYCNLFLFSNYIAGGESTRVYAKGLLLQLCSQDFVHNHAGNIYIPVQCNLEIHPNSIDLIPTNKYNNDTLE